MNKDEIEKLIKKYKAGESTLQEDETLFDNVENVDSNLKVWSSYVRYKKKKAPANFSDTIWTSIQNRKRRQQRRLFGFSLAAAAIVLLITISINDSSQSNTSYEKKAALLSEALSMFPDENHGQAKQNIIYEDDMIIIYLASN